VPIRMPTTYARSFESWRSCVQKHLTKFETWLASDPPNGLKVEEWKPFPILTAEDRSLEWLPSVSNEIDQARSRGYPRRVGGVYLYIDNCAQDDLTKSMPRDQDRFTVIRYIGATTNTFSTRPPKVTKTGWPMDWRLKAIIPFDGRIVALAKALEEHLLSRIRTTHNEHRQGFGLGQEIFTEYYPPSPASH
jgi:hypothetical protein